MNKVDLARGLDGRWVKPQSAVSCRNQVTPTRSSHRHQEPGGTRSSPPDWPLGLYSPQLDSPHADSHCKHFLFPTSEAADALNDPPSLGCVSTTFRRTQCHLEHGSTMQPVPKQLASRFWSTRNVNATLLIIWSAYNKMSLGLNERNQFVTQVPFNRINAPNHII